MKELTIEATPENVDNGKPYDPLAKADPDTTQSIEDRKIGGLGIFIVKKSMDAVNYEYKDGKNILTIKKSFNSETDRAPLSEPFRKGAISMKTSEETKKEINTEAESKETKKNEGEINDNDAKAVAGGLYYQPEKSLTIQSAI